MGALEVQSPDLSSLIDWAGTWWKDAICLNQPAYISRVYSLMPHISWAFTTYVVCVLSWMTIEMKTKTVPELRNKKNLSEAQGECFLEWNVCSGKT